MSEEWKQRTGYFYIEGDRQAEAEGMPITRPRLAITPYFYIFEVGAKGRWLGKSVLNVFLEEFQHHGKDYYEAAVADGRLWVTRTRPQSGGADHKAAINEASSGPSPTTPKSNSKDSKVWKGREPAIIRDAESLLGAAPLRLQHGDIVHHLIHKHELTAFANDPITIIDVTLLSSHGLLAIDKPSSLPAHPSGRFFQISLSEILSLCFVPNCSQGGGTPAFPRDCDVVEYLLGCFCFGESPDTPVPLLFEHNPALFMSNRTLLRYLRWGPSITPEDKAAFYKFFSLVQRKGKASASEAAAPPIVFAPCYRLDRATSGVILLSCNSSAARWVGRALQEKTKSHVEGTSVTLPSADNKEPTSDPSLGSPSVDKAMLGKTYLARVSGSLFSLLKDSTAPQYPSDVEVVHFDMQTGQIITDVAASEGESVIQCIRCSYPIHAWDASTYSINPDPSTVVTKETAAAGEKRGREEEHVSPGTCEPPTVQSQTSYRAASKAAKSSLTLFRPMWLDEATNQTIVECFPLTGRTHQIRVHLGGMGFPIADDHKYLRHYGFVAPTAETMATATSDPAISLDKVYYDPNRVPCALRQRIEEDGKSTPSLLHDPLCDECLGTLPVTAFGDEGSTICLHAYRYTLTIPAADGSPERQKVFVAPLPSWAVRT